MIEISGTTFIDYLAAQGTAKVTCVRNARNRYDEEFDVKTDFYKYFREGVQDMHLKGNDPATLQTVIDGLADPKKTAAYKELVKGYRRWMGKRTFKRLPRARYKWVEGELTLVVNPELHLLINGEEWVIKLYMREKRIRSVSVEAMLHLLAGTPAAEKGAKVGILDVRRSKLITKNRPVRDIDKLVRGEARCFVSIWHDFDGRTGAA